MTARFIIAAIFAVAVLALANNHLAGIRKGWTSAEGLTGIGMAIVTILYGVGAFEASNLS
jgi:hypothetical protein